MEQAILAAIEEKFGVRILLSPDETPEQVKAQFYKTRKDMIMRGNVLASFISCQCPANHPTELWLVKKPESKSDA